MKNFIILLCISFGFLSVSVSADNITNTILTNSENLVCTMQYEPVCWLNWHTYWNSCMAWNNEVIYNGECDSYTDNNLYLRLENFYFLSFKSKLSHYSVVDLTYLMWKMDSIIDATKVSNMSNKEQKTRITVYRFVKNIIPETINTKNIYQSKERVEFKNATYMINWEYVTFKDWLSTENNKTTRYFWNAIEWDFNNDWTDDVAFIVTQNSGGSWTFYYVVAALLTNNWYAWTNAILLWDRIAPQSSNFVNWELVINYADREVNEPMTAQPSVWVSKYLKITNWELVEYIK